MIANVIAVPNVRTRIPPSDKQIAFATLVRGARVRHNKGPVPPKRPRIPIALSERPRSIVCVTGEANAWPYRSKELRTTHREELVHWVAHRPATGETLDVILRPRNPLAPSTPPHVGLTENALLSGDSVAELFERWSSFTREDDVVCSWGHYPIGIFGATGGTLPKTRLDLRQVARVLMCGRVGTMDAVLENLAIAPSSIDSLGRGRAGVRAAQLARIAAHLSRCPDVPSAARSTSP
jgi:DTW domain-containing protein